MTQKNVWQHFVLFTLFLTMTSQSAPCDGNSDSESYHGIAFVNKHNSSSNSHELLCGANILNSKMIFITPDCRKKYENLNELFVTLDPYIKIVDMTSAPKIYAHKEYLDEKDTRFHNYTILILSKSLRNVKPVVIPDQDFIYQGKLKTFREVRSFDKTDNTPHREVKAYFTDIIHCANKTFKYDDTVYNQTEFICTRSPTDDNSTKLQIFGIALCSIGNYEASVICAVIFSSRTDEERYLKLGPSPIIPWIQNYLIESSNMENNILAIVRVFVVACILLFAVTLIVRKCGDNNYLRLNVPVV